MADSSRIEDLRRRVQKDPASIAFAQLAEELRRAGRFDESIEICRAGLTIHPGYLSARVTLGRALIELNQLPDAQTELEHVLASAPENLAAIRGLADISHRDGDLPAALSYYRAALALAKNDPDLQETVNDLAKQIEPPAPPAEEGLSLEQITQELSVHRPPPVPAAPPSVDFFAESAKIETLAETPAAVPAAPTADAASAGGDQVDADFFAALSSPEASSAPAPEPMAGDTESETASAPSFDTTAPAVVDVDSTIFSPDDWSEPHAGDPAHAAGPEAAQTTSDDWSDPSADRTDAADEPHASSAPPIDPHATRVIGALENWLEAIHVTRDQRGA